MKHIQDFESFLGGALNESVLDKLQKIEGKEISLSDFQVGDILEVSGWVMMKDVEPGFYVITKIDDLPSATFVKCNEKGKPVSKKMIRFPLLSIMGKFGNMDWGGDWCGNGIRLFKKQ